MKWKTAPEINWNVIKHVIILFIQPGRILTSWTGWVLMWSAVWRVRKINQLSFPLNNKFKELDAYLPETMTRAAVRASLCSLQLWSIVTWCHWSAWSTHWSSWGSRHVVSVCHSIRTWLLCFDPNAFRHQHQLQSNSIVTCSRSSPVQLS